MSKKTQEETVLACPECGKEFTRPAALGAHRNRAHGIRGKSAKRRPVSPPPARRRSGEVVDAKSLGDRLLGLVFGETVPARVEVMEAAGSWLEEADRLAALR